jgi:membrane-bound ClpP family serine protease
MAFLQTAAGAGLLVFLAGMLLVTESLVKARGLAAFLGLSSLVLYVYTQNSGWDWWMMGLLLGGLVLVILDGKLIQDGTLAGLGLLLILVALVMPTGNWLTGTLVGLMWVLGILVGFSSLKILPRREIWDKLVLKSSLSKEMGYSSMNEEYRELEGKEGIAVTDMRPSGTVEIGGKRYSAISNGTWVEAGSSVYVISVNGTRMMVEKTKQSL